MHLFVFLGLGVLAAMVFGRSHVATAPPDVPPGRLPLPPHPPPPVPPQVPPTAMHWRRLATDAGSTLDLPGGVRLRASLPPDDVLGGDPTVPLLCSSPDLACARRAALFGDGDVLPTDWPTDDPNRGKAGTFRIEGVTPGDALDVRSVMPGNATVWVWNP